MFQSCCESVCNFTGSILAACGGLVVREWSEIMSGEGCKF